MDREDQSKVGSTGPPSRSSSIAVGVDPDFNDIDRQLEGAKKLAELEEIEIKRKQAINLSLLAEKKQNNAYILIQSSFFLTIIACVFSIYCVFTFPSNDVRFLVSQFVLSAAIGAAISSFIAFQLMDFLSGKR